MRMRNPGDVLSLAIAGVLTTALSAEAGSRVIVSTTLDSTLEIFDADSLAEFQAPLPSRGGGPVRLWVETFDGKDYLFAANHGAALGSVGYLPAQFQRFRRWRVRMSQHGRDALRVLDDVQRSRFGDRFGHGGLREGSSVEDDRRRPVSSRDQDD